MSASVFRFGRLYRHHHTGIVRCISSAVSQVHVHCHCDSRSLGRSISLVVTTSLTTTPPSVERSSAVFSRTIILLGWFSQCRKRVASTTFPRERKATCHRPLSIASTQGEEEEFWTRLGTRSSKTVLVCYPAHCCSLACLDRNCLRGVAKGVGVAFAQRSRLGPRILFWGFTCPYLCLRHLPTSAFDFRHICLFTQLRSSTWALFWWFKQRFLLSFGAAVLTVWTS